MRRRRALRNAPSNSRVRVRILHSATDAWRGRPRYRSGGSDGWTRGSTAVASRRVVVECAVRVHALPRRRVVARVAVRIVERRGEVIADARWGIRHARATVRVLLLVEVLRGVLGVTERRVARVVGGVVRPPAMAPVDEDDDKSRYERGCAA